MMKIIDKVIAWNPKRIMLSGGEPMMREDFLFLLEYVRKNYSGKITLSTNSLLISKKNITQLVNCCDTFEISIDGVDEKTCSFVRGVGVFDKVCNKVKMIQEYGGKNINLSMVFSDKNQHLKEEFIILNNKLRTQPVCRTFSAVGRGKENKNFFTEKNSDDIYIPEDYLVKDYGKPFGISICSAGKNELLIGCDGRIYPCQNYWEDKYVLGNILYCDSLDEIINKESEICTCSSVERNHPKNLVKCNGCSVRLFCWTCPGELSDIHTEEAFKKRCEILKPILMERVWNKAVSL